MEDFTDIEEIRDMQETNEQDIEYDKIYMYEDLADIEYFEI